MNIPLKWFVRVRVRAHFVPYTIRCVLINGIIFSSFIKFVRTNYTIEPFLRV